jgi:hypothetical protein
MIQPPVWITLESWEAFHECRRKLKAPLTCYAEKLVVIELCKLKTSGEDPQACLDQSIVNGWRDVFPLRDKGLKQSAKAHQECQAYLDDLSSIRPDPERARAAVHEARRGIRRIA